MILPIKITEFLTVEFSFGLQKGQKQTFEQEGIDDEVLDLEWDYKLYSKQTNKFIEAETDWIERQIIEHFYNQEV